MTKEEYRTWKWNYKFNGLAIGGDDELGELLREIYYSGYNDGFRHAINLLQQFEGGHCLDILAASMILKKYSQEMLCLFILLYKMPLSPTAKQRKFWT